MCSLGLRTRRRWPGRQAAGEAPQSARLQAARRA
ncbi:hypothetical protein DBR41_23915 [Pseudomonas sp. HMWF010]|nr:hypothetical protein DBR21_12290 [Caulobacter sp. HMWF009]PTT05663.1 hypothetical protein DBR10_15175 [Caulobacter sp. HMWF025]PTT77787.1 hypothetical protein DBR41_23915 [Pseudomonas sp. HMWF010]